MFHLHNKIFSIFILNYKFPYPKFYSVFPVFSVIYTWYSRLSSIRLSKYTYPWRQVIFISMLYLFYWTFGVALSKPCYFWHKISLWSSQFMAQSVGVVISRKEPLGRTNLLTRFLTLDCQYLSTNILPENMSQSAAVLIKQFFNIFIVL